MPSFERYSSGGGGGGADFTGFSDGSVVFISSEAGAEDNTNFFWDDTNDGLVIGDNSSSRSSSGAGFTSRLTTSSSDGDFNLAMEAVNDTAALGPFSWFLRQRTTGGAVQSGDSLGKLGYYGHDGTDYELGASINAEATAAASGALVPSKLSFLVSAPKSSIEGGGYATQERFRLGGGSITLDGIDVASNMRVVEEDGVGFEAAFFRYNSSSAGSNFGLFKARGTESSPSNASPSDTIGQIAACARASGAFVQSANLQFKAGTTADAGAIFFQTQSSGGGLATRMSIDEDGLVEVGTGGSFNLVSGSGDLGVGGDFEVVGQSRFEDPIGWRTAPESVSAFVSDYSDTTVVNFLRVVSKYTGTGLPASGYNVMNYTSYDQSTSSNSAGVHAIRLTTYFDRAATSSAHQLAALQVAAYGQASTRTISSGSHEWKGIEVNAAGVAGARVSGGNFLLVDCDLGSAPTDYSGAASFDHYSLRCAGVSRFNDTVFVSIDDGGDVGIGTASPAVPLEIEEVVGSSVNIADGDAATLMLDPGYDKTGGIGVTITRHNYIELNDPSLSNSSGSGTIALTNACVFRFDAAAGTHKAVDAGTTKASPGTVSAWVKVNVNGTVHYVPSYTSKTS